MIPRRTECAVNGESLITIRYKVLRALRQGNEMAGIEKESSTLTNPMIVFHNNHERAQRATKRFFLPAFVFAFSFSEVWVKTIRIFEWWKQNNKRTWKKKSTTELCVPSNGTNSRQKTAKIVGVQRDGNGRREEKKIRWLEYHNFPCDGALV